MKQAALHFAFELYLSAWISLLFNGCHWLFAFREMCRVNWEKGPVWKKPLLLLLFSAHLHSGTALKVLILPSALKWEPNINARMMKLHVHMSSVGLQGLYYLLLLFKCFFFSSTGWKHLERFRKWIRTHVVQYTSQIQGSSCAYMCVLVWSWHCCHLIGNGLFPNLCCYEPSIPSLVTSVKSWCSLL